MSNTFVKLGSVAEFINGAAFKPQDWGESGLRIIRIQNLTDPNKPFNRTERTVSELVRVQPGDLLVSWSATLGVFEWNDSEEALLNQHIFRVLPNIKIVDKRYLRHGLEVAILDMKKHLHGATMQHVNRGEFLSTKFYLPPLEEQKRIAEILDQAEELRRKRKGAIAQLDTLTQSIFLEMFGDVVKNQKNWKTDRMENLMRIRRGGSPRPIEKYLGGDINWIKIGDGTKGSDIYLESCAVKITRDGLSKTVFLKKGSLIFANCGVSLGFARILKIDGCIHDGWLSFDDIDEIKLDKLFLLKALNSITNHFRAIAPDGTQPNLNTGLMKNFLMILPPLSLQKEFAQKVEAVEELKKSHRTSLSELDALFASLQHRAFRGEL